MIPVFLALAGDEEDSPKGEEASPSGGRADRWGKVLSGAKRLFRIGKTPAAAEEAAIEGGARGLGQGAGIAVGYAAARGVTAGGKFIAGGIIDPLNVFILLAFVVHIIDVFVFGANPGQPARWYLHVFLALLAWLWVFRDPQESIWRRLFVYLGLMLAAIYFVYAGNYAARGVNWFFSGSSIDPGAINLIRVVIAGLTNTILVPVWIYYAVFFQEIREPTRISKLIAFLFAMIFIVATFSAVARSGYLPTSWEEISPEQRQQAQEVITEVRTVAPRAAQSIWQTFTGGIRDVIMGPHGLVASAVGEDIYASQVDKNKDEPLGVYLENLQPSSEQYYEDEPVTIWATLKARTLDPDDHIRATLSCYADQGQLSTTALCPVTPKIAGDTNPDPASTSIAFDIFGFEQQDISCTIPANKLLHGFRTVTFNAKFDFRTDAYIKAYFMENSRLRALRRETIDPLALYGITDRTPIATYSNGPIAVGMMTTQPLVGLDDTAMFRLGISLNNRWEGKIKRIKNVIIKISESMELYGCDVAFAQRACEDQAGECENGKYTNVYELNDPGLRQLADIKTAKSFNCNVRVKSGQLQAALGNVPLMTHYFKTSVDYDYELEKAISVNVRHPPDKPNIEPPGVACSAVSNAPSQYEYLTSNYFPSSSEETLVNTILQNYGSFIDEAVAAYPNVPKALIIAFIIHESGGNPLSVSGVGAAGLMQLMSHTSKGRGNTRVIGQSLLDSGFEPVGRTPTGDRDWESYGSYLQGYIAGKSTTQLVAEDPRFDPRQNILWGTAYLSELLSRFSDDFYKTTAGYNAGPNRVEEWIANGQWESFVRSGYQCTNPSCTYDPVQTQILPFPRVQSYVNKIIGTFKMVDRILNPGRQVMVSIGDYTWPLDTLIVNRISDCFSRVTLPNGRTHYGIDIPAPENSDLLAIAEGVVQEVCGHPTVRCGEPGLPSCTGENSCGGQGNFIEVRTDQGWYYRFMHLNQELVAPSGRVTKGQAIGKSGNTGHSTGPHLHMQTYASTSQRSATAFNGLCLFDPYFVSSLTFDDSGNCDVYKTSVTVTESPAYQQQCLEMQQMLGGVS